MVRYYAAHSRSIATIDGLRDMLKPFARILDFYRGQQGAARELTLFGCCLLLGLVVLPFAIWIAGRVTLGTYAGGGPFALWADYLRGLGQGSVLFWIALFGPYVLLLLWRALRALIARSAA